MTEPNWEMGLWTVVLAGIQRKIRSGEPLTEAQQRIQEMAPEGFDWNRRIDWEKWGKELGLGA